MNQAKSVLGFSLYASQLPGSSCCGASAPDPEPRRVAVLIDAKTAVASGNLLDNDDEPQPLSVVAVPRLSTSALLR